MAPPLIFPIVIQQQQHGGALVSGTGGDSQYATYSVAALWDTVGLPDETELTAIAGHGVKSVRIRRGRDDALTMMGAGTATIVLHDPDGRYNPLNTASPLAGLLIPMVDVVIEANNGGPVAPLFAGFVRSIEHDPSIGVQETRIECIDRLVWFDRAMPDFLETGSPNLTTGDVIAAISTQVGGTVGTPSYDDGDTIGTTFDADGTKSALTLVEELLVAERGVFFIDAAGGDRYEDRANRTARTSEATISDTMMSLRPGVDLDRVANRARVTRTGGDVQEANDVTSQALYGVADVGNIETPYLVDDTAAMTLATYLVDQFKDPRSPMYSLDLMNRDVTTMDQILQRELQDRITVADSRGGTSGDYHIEGIEHEITEGGKWHRCRWLLSARGSGTQTGSTGVVGGSKVTPTPAPIYVEEGATIPTAPFVDGTELYYVADADNGVVWHFRYRAASGSSYKWEFVGGPPLTSLIATSETRVGTTYAAITTAGPAIALPFAGDYIVAIGCKANNNTDGNGALMSYDIGGTGAVDADSIEVFQSAATSVTATNYREKRKNGLTAVTLTAKYKTSVGGTAAFWERSMSVIPVRVSA